MMVMPRIVLALIVAFVAVAGASAQTRSPKRFGNVQEIYLPLDGIEPVTLETPPRVIYPSSARASNRVAQMTVAFIVDTLGYVEMPTVSLLSSPKDHDFFLSICRALPRARFKMASPKRRTLAVWPFNFSLEGAPDQPLLISGDDADARTLLRLLKKAASPQEAVALLETRPHCT